MGGRENQDQCLSDLLLNKIFFSILGAWSNYSTGSKVGIIIGILCIIIIISVIIAVVYRKKGGRINLFRSTPRGGRGANVMKTVASYHNKQYESDKTNIKVAGKKGPQKFNPLQK